MMIVALALVLLWLGGGAKVTTLDLSDEEAEALVALVRRTLDQARFPMAPRHAPLRAILALLDPPKPATCRRRSLRG